MTMSQEATGIAGILGAFKLLCTCVGQTHFSTSCPGQYDYERGH